MSLQTPFTKMTNQSEGETISKNVDAVLNDFHGLGKQNYMYLNNVLRNISLDSSDDAILILKNTKITTYAMFRDV